MAGKKRKGVDESALTHEERERRRVQRELQALSKKLRGEGKEYKPQKYKRKVIMEVMTSSPRPGVTVGAARREKKKLKTEAKRAVRVVVLPIFWEQNPEESKAVKETAEEVASLLQSSLGVRVVRDDNNDFTPGRRMRHWEELKVPVRVEIGPNDVKRRSAVVAIAGEAGTVAKKKTLSMGKAMVKHIQSILVGMGIECKKEEVDEKQKEEEGEEEEEEEEDQEGEQQGEGEKDGVAASHGGDDMDDFDLEVADPEEEALTMTRVDIAKKKRKIEKEKKKEEKRAGRESKEGGEEKGSVGWEDLEKKVKSKSTKVVKF